MLNRILITGARERPKGFELGDGKLYEAALLVRLDLETGETELMFEKNEGGSNYPAEHPNLQFTRGCVDGNTLWLSTDTEILEVGYPDLKVRQVISHPSFQNIHSCDLIDGVLYVTSTGLDLVISIDPKTGDIIKHYSADHKPVWHRFSPDTDYRQVHSTRPHHCHPNQVFKFDNECWVTRCTQEDAVPLDSASKRIDISGPDKVIAVHDGNVVDDKVYFTSVDGCLVITDPVEQRVLESVDICMENNLGRIGWCRGLHIEDGIAYIGFSSIRRTRQSKKLAWLGDSVSKVFGKPASLIVYDIENRKLLNRFDIPQFGLHAVYGIMPEPETETEK